MQLRERRRRREVAITEITYMCKVVVKDRCSPRCHTGRILIGWANEEMVADCLTHLVLVLKAITYILPIGVLHWKFNFHFPCWFCVCMCFVHFVGWQIKYFKSIIGIGKSNEKMLQIFASIFTLNIMVSRSGSECLLNIVFMISRNLTRGRDVGASFSKKSMKSYSRKYVPEINDEQILVLTRDISESNKKLIISEQWIVHSSQSTTTKYSC